MFRGILLATALMVVTVGASYADKMADDNIAKCKRFYAEVANKGNLAVVDELVAENFVEHEVFPGLEPNREGLKKFFGMMRTAFPDFECNVDFYIADGDKVAAYITMSGTQKGEFMGMPAMGKKFSVKTVDIIRIKDGQAVEHWGVTDAMTMMQQLGAAGQPGAMEQHKGGGK